MIFPLSQIQACVVSDDLLKQKHQISEALLNTFSRKNSID